MLSVFNNNIQFVWLKRPAFSTDAEGTYTLPLTITTIFTFSDGMIKTKDVNGAAAPCGLKAYTSTSITIKKDSYADNGGYIFIIAN